MSVAYTFAGSCIDIPKHNDVLITRVSHRLLATEFSETVRNRFFIRRDLRLRGFRIGSLSYIYVRSMSGRHYSHTGSQLKKMFGHDRISLNDVCQHSIVFH